MVHLTGFSFCFLSVFLAIFILLLSNYNKGWLHRKNLHWLLERLASLGIRGEQLRASLKPHNTVVLWYTGVSGGPWIGTSWYWETPVSRIFMLEEKTLLYHWGIYGKHTFRHSTFAFFFMTSKCKHYLSWGRIFFYKKKIITHIMLVLSPERILRIWNLEEANAHSLPQTAGR